MIGKLYKQVEASDEWDFCLFNSEDEEIYFQNAAGFTLGLIEAVKQMRRFQKDYFATKNYDALNNARKAEAKVDKMIEDIETPNLFNQ